MLNGIGPRGIPRTKVGNVWFLVGIVNDGAARSEADGLGESEKENAGQLLRGEQAGTNPVQRARAVLRDHPL